MEYWPARNTKQNIVTKYRPCIKDYNIETADYVVSVGEEEFEVHIMCGSFQVLD